MKTKVGEKDFIVVDGYETEVTVVKAYRSDAGWHIAYKIGDDYITQPYFYPQEGTFDTAGIEATTGMPVDYANKSLDDFRWDYYPENTDEQKHIVDTFLFRFDVFLRENMGLYIVSRTRGSGKTLLSCCLGNEIIKRRGLNVKFISIAEYIEASRNRTAEPFTDASVLIIDDIGVQDDTKEWINEIVYRLINRRYEQKKLTILTSNVPIEKCSSDARVVSRIESMARELQIPEVAVRSKQAWIRKKKVWDSIAGGEL